MTQSLRQLARQLAETWKHVGVNQRVSLVLGTGVVLAGCFASRSGRAGPTLCCFTESSTMVRPQR